MDKPNQLSASTLVNRALCLDSSLVIDNLTSDLLTIHSNESNSSTHTEIVPDRIKVLKKWVVELSKAQPSISFMRSTFFHVMTFLPSVGCEGYQLVDLTELKSLINELKSSYDTLCDLDCRILRRILESSMDLKDIKTDASFLIHWALIEASKFSIGNKFNQEIFVYQYLNSIQTIVDNVNYFNKIQAQFLCNFWQLLDKQLQDRITDSSTCKLVSPRSELVEEFFMLNRSKFQLWSLKHRREFARLGLVVDNPAECWRNMNIKLCLDLESKFLGSTQGTPSFSLTLMSLSAKNWQDNLQLLTMSAKELGDKNLLQGLERMACNEGYNIGSYGPVSVMLANLEGRYEDAYKAALEMSDASDQTLMEFLNAAIELDRWDKYEQQVKKLKSSKSKFLYEQYHKIKSSHLGVIQVSDVKSWLGSWSQLEESDTSPSDNLQSIGAQIDLIVPTLLVSIAKNRSTDLIDYTKQMIGRDIIAQSPFCLESVNKNYKLFNILLNGLASGSPSEDDRRIVECHSNDAEWNNKLYRHLKDLDLGQRFESVPYKAAKFNLRNGNLDLGMNIAQELIDGSASTSETKISASILMTKYKSISSEAKLGELCQLASKTALCKDINLVRKREMILDITRHQLRLGGHSDGLEAMFRNLNRIELGLESTRSKYYHSKYARQIPIFDETAPLSCDNKSLIKTLINISDCLGSPDGSDNAEGVENLFLLQIDLLKLISNQSSHSTNFDGHGVKCALKILQLIQDHRDLLGERMREKFVKSFQETLPIWLNIRKSLISLLVFQENPSDQWSCALTELLEQLVIEWPYLFIYEAIVHMIDLDSSTSSSKQRLADRLTESEQHVADSNSNRTREVWQRIYDTLKSPAKLNIDLSEMLMETRRFIEEIKRISYLPTDSILKLADRIIKKLDSCLYHFQDSELGCDLRQQAACTAKLRAIASQHIQSIRILVDHCKHTDTALDTWFSSNLGGLIRSVHEQLKLIEHERTGFEQRQIVARKSIMALESCRLNVNRFYEESKYKFFTEMISPMLSRLEPSNILMPGYELKHRRHTNGDNNPRPVTIKSVSQAVSLIHSLTRPKSLKFIGSDGVNRSFLLKAHEDLRLDQTIMELFGSLNLLFQSKKITRDQCRLRKYSVTPISTRSGLIQWIEAPSLGSFGRDWLKSAAGQMITKELYDGTCRALCKPGKPKGEHKNCRPPKNGRCLDLFYQLLWAEMRPSSARPSRSTSLNYRKHSPGHFENVLKKLLLRMPKELVSNQLWFNSYNSHEFWLKTQKFIRSCATISMVGYLIGLGDRHSDNILIDCQSGEFVHVDYNLCFDFAKDKMTIPEKVPFRLTPNIARAFGFAGLEGAFTNCCRDVWNILKDNKPVLLNHLNATQLSFMINPEAKSNAGDPRNTDPFELSTLDRNNKHQNNKDTRLAHEVADLNLCSQEMLEEFNEIVALEERKPAGFNAEELSDAISPMSPPQSSSSFRDEFANKIPARTAEKFPELREDVQHDIRTPPKLSIVTSKRIFRRIEEKLNGIDDELRPQCLVGSSEKQTDGTVGLSTNEQVDALIREATSFKNQAAMFEGWMAWL